MSHDFRDRLTRAIPGGAHTYSRGWDQFPSTAPDILVSGQGARVLDVYGRSYLDFGMGLRSVTLGYAEPRVVAAAIRGANLGNSLTRPSTTELRAAESLIELIPWVDMVKFTKNASNATTAAVRLARSATGRDLVLVPREQPFFSFDDWFIGATPMDSGVPDVVKGMTRRFKFRDVSDLRRLLDEVGHRTAAVVVEPATHIVPCLESCSDFGVNLSACTACPSHQDNFLWELRRECSRRGIVLIFDETITGFRWHLQGGAGFFGVAPDLVVFGKAMSNGFSVAALAGRRELMDQGGVAPPGARRTFLLSSTHGAEMVGLEAFLETLRIYQEEHVVSRLWETGQRIRQILSRAIAESSLTDVMAIRGPAIAPVVEFRTESDEINGILRTVLAQELARRGVLMPWISFSTAHGPVELNQLEAAFMDSLPSVLTTHDRGDAELLEGPIISPVFRRYN